MEASTGSFLFLLCISLLLFFPVQCLWMCLGKEGEGGVWQMLTKLTKRGGGVGEMLTIADKGGRGGLDPPSPFLADIICEQPLGHSKSQRALKLHFWFKSCNNFTKGMDYDYLISCIWKGLRR